MTSEMAEQPRVLRELLAHRADVDALVHERVRTRPVSVVLLARGTSDNAAVFGRYLLEATLGVPAGLAAPSLWTRYEYRPDLRGHLLIALSQSGQTPEIERVVRLAHAAGATTIAVTNDAESPLATAAGSVVALRAGIERAVPATKTFTAQVAALALLAHALGGRGIADPGALVGVPALQEAVLADDGHARAIAADVLAPARAVVAVGSGYLYAVALEAALKLLETTSLPVLAYSASDFVHGPLAVAAPDVPVLCFAAADGPVRSDVEQAAMRAAERGAPVVWISERPDRARVADAYLQTPAASAEPLEVLVHALRAQQLARATSLVLERDPDAPLGLRKVTPTT